MRSCLKVFLISLFLFPVITFAQTSNFETSAWIPYWRSEDGVQSALENLDAFTEINPFVYTVRQDGALFEASSLNLREWRELRDAAEQNNIRFVPTITWANAEAMDEIFKDPNKRQNHIHSIVSEVYKKNLDGIDIDYEGKYARTWPYFSLFLKELNEAIGYDRWIMCTIEARTPLDSRYSSISSIPVNIKYSNDFSEINKYCDRVRIMAYDQGRIDLKLNEQNGDPYIPVADPAWVEKVVRLAMAEIDKNKISVGVPTYGYEYDMFLSLFAGGFTSILDSAKPGEIQYSRLWSFNPRYALEHAEKINEKPERNKTGEMMFIYPAHKSSDPDAIPLDFATRVMVWNDAESIRQKTELAKNLGVRGVSVFKIDGGQDSNLLSILESFKTASNIKKKPPTLAAKTANNISDATSRIPSRNLDFGMRNEDVRTLQKLLNLQGFTLASSGPGSPGNETLMFGDATKAALIRFQKSKGIMPAVGYYGPKTRAVFSQM